MDQTVREIMARRRLESRPEAERFAEECRAKLITAANLPTTYVLSVVITASPLTSEPLVSMKVVNHKEFNHSIPRGTYIDATAAFNAVCNMLVSEGFSEDKAPHYARCPFMKSFSVVV